MPHCNEFPACPKKAEVAKSSFPRKMTVVRFPSGSGLAKVRKLIPPEGQLFPHRHTFHLTTHIKPFKNV